MGSTNNGNGHKPKKKRPKKNSEAVHFELGIMQMVSWGIHKGLPEPFMVNVLTKATQGLIMAHAVSTTMRMVSAKTAKKN